MHKNSTKECFEDLRDEIPKWKKNAQEVYAYSLSIQDRVTETMFTNSTDWMSDKQFLPKTMRNTVQKINIQLKYNLGDSLGSNNLRKSVLPKICSS